MSDDIRASTCCPTRNEDGTDGLFGYAVDGTSAHPSPTITCLGNITVWLVDGQYIVPDFSSAITIDGLCALDSEFTIVQNPPAGTVIEVAGGIVIEITVTDRFGNVETCNFTVTVIDPEDPDGDSPPTVLPPWIYTPYLLSYWPINDTLCIDIPSEDPPCLFRFDVAALIGGTARHLTNGGDALLSPSQSIVRGFSPGPTFHRGSMWANEALNGYLYHEDTTALRLLNTSFTIRMGFKLVAMADGAVWNLVGKYDTVGYRIYIERVGSEYRLKAELKNGSTTLETIYVPISLDVWIYVAMAFDAATGQLRLYLDGVRERDTTSAGFVLDGEVSEFRIGQPSSGGDPTVLACWSLDNTSFLDSVGSRDLTNSGVTLGAGKINDGAVLITPAGEGIYLERADDSALRLNSGSFSIRTWMRFTSGNPSIYMVRKMDAAFNNGYRLHMPNSTGYRFEMANAGVVDTLNGATSLFTLGFVHIVFTFNSATRAAKLYLNGVLDGSSIFTNAAPGGTADPLRLCMSYGTGATFDQDEISIWTKELSAAEIVADYNSGNGTACPFAMTSTAEAYHDEVGIWTQAWNDARVAEDYAIMTALS